MQELTRGQKLVGVSFNPSKDNRVDVIKDLYSKIADEIYALRDEKTLTESQRVCDVALDKLVSAKMWSIESIFKE